MGVDGHRATGTRTIWPSGCTGWGRWAAVLVQALRDLRAADAPEVAAALAFYALVSLFPLLLAGAVVASTVAEPAWAVGRIAALLGEFLPRGEFEVEVIVADAVAQRRRVGVLSVLVLLVGGRRVFGALTKALNRVSDVDERRDPVKRRAGVELALLVGIGGVFALALSSGPLLGLLVVGVGQRGIGASLAMGAMQAVLLMATFSLVYAFVPRGPRDRRAVLVGAAAATVLFVLARWLFMIWLARIWGGLGLVYGSLATAVVLLLWAWYVALITLFGGALASHAKVMLVEGQCAEEAGRRHNGGSR